MCAAQPSGKEKKAREESGSEISQLQFGEGKRVPQTLAAVRTEPLNGSLEWIHRSKSNLFSITSNQQNTNGTAAWGIQHSADAPGLYVQPLSQQRHLVLVLMENKFYLLFDRVHKLIQRRRIHPGFPKFLAQLLKEYKNLALKVEQQEGCHDVRTDPWQSCCTHSSDGLVALFCTCSIHRVLFDKR